MSLTTPPGPEWLAEVSRRFESGWRCGTPASLADVVAGAPEDVRPALFRRLLEIEREYRGRAGQPLTPDEARDRYGGLGAWAGPILDDVVPAETALVLDVVHGPYAGRSYSLAGHATFTIGRQPGHYISLPDDPHLSRAHCLIEVNPPFARVVDLGSKTGTVVNGHRQDQADLRDGDEVRAGLTVFRVRVPGVQGFGTLSLPDPRTTVSHTPGGPPAVPGYRLGGELGRGAMGVVYHATRESDGAEVAVKTLLPAIPPTRTALGRFIREADILRRLSHPNIVAFRDAGATGPHLYFVMEFVPGTSAGALVATHGPLPAGRVLGWAVQFLDALAHAHETGFVHRDVKPSNLLVRGAPGSEVVKVSDFGLARAYEESSMSGLTVANTSGGTPAFMPPEQVTDFRSVRPAADQYAAAATLFHLLTGRGVYEKARSTQDMLRRILVEDPIPLRPDAPPPPGRFGPVIRRALARDPADRFSSVRAMLASLTAPDHGPAGRGESS
ncbi:MAG TPA: FHA domain-containing serine/threonine-protein kinase [Urbifossiella sp.]|nr:FHA domain-containing serine/threonine-protein kinase [Urbifossiella sp.]